MAFDGFISYASEDKTVADAVCAALESHAIRCWIAPRDVIPGMAYGEAIIDAIRGCRVMILVFSSKSNLSPHIPKEIERAASAGVPIIPFRIEDVKPGKSLDYFIGSVHWLDALTPPLERHLERLAENVQMLLSRDNPVIERAESAATAAPGATKSTRTMPAAAPTHEARPPWLYVALGVLSVLVVVFAVLFSVRKPSTPAQVAPAPAAPAPASATPPPASQSSAAVAPPATSSPSPANARAGSVSKPTPEATAPKSPRRTEATTQAPVRPVAQPGAALSPNAAPSSSTPFAAAQLLDRGFSAYKSKDFAQAAELYQKACDGGERKGCTNLGLMYYNGQGKAKDLDRAAGLFKRACDAGGTGGCLNLGLMYSRGESVPKDPQRAADLFKIACDGGAAPGCTNLGLMYAKGENLVQDLSRAAGLYERACGEGNGPGCNFLGLLYEHGRGVQKDVGRAVDLFRKACDLGLDLGCQNLAKAKQQRRD